MEQTRALNALAPFLALSKTATSSRAAADVVAQATAAPNTFVFAELLQAPSIQALRQDEQFAGVYKLLEIFSWGTWQDYKKSASLPQLSDAQAHKLRLLTLVNLVSQRSSTSQLSYANLQQALSLTSPLELEHLVTDAIYANLVNGVLDPAAQLVIINSVAPLRDLPPGSIQGMAAELQAWTARCDGVLQELDAQIAQIKTNAAAKAEKEAETRKQMDEAAKMVDPAQSNGKGAEALAGPDGSQGHIFGQQEEDETYGDAMDIDSTAPSIKKSKGIFGLRKR